MVKLKNLKAAIEFQKEFRESNERKISALKSDNRLSRKTESICFIYYARSVANYSEGDELFVKYKTRNKDRYPQVQEFERKVFIKEVTGWNTSSDGGVKPCVMYKLGIINKDGSRSERNHLGGKYISEEELLKSIVDGTE